MNASGESAGPNQRPFAAGGPRRGTLASVPATSTEHVERLSSLLTFFYKFIFPTLWLGGFGLGTVWLVINPPRDGPHPLMFAAGLVFGAIVFYRWGFSLKKVRATENGLLVSNYRRETFVAYEQISSSSVRENKFISIRPITVQVRSATAFGSSFVFMPYTAFVLFADHPAVTRIRERAEAARKERS